MAAELPPILPLAYFPPVPWLAAACGGESAWVECWQPYQKQQITSRAWIKSPGGPLALTLPVERRGAQLPLREKKLSYREAWPRNHWRSIYYAYKGAPYFDHYAPRVEALYARPIVFLADFLWESTCLAAELLRLPCRLEATEALCRPAPGQADYRMHFPPHLGNLPPAFQPRAYTQVFGNFTPGLSALDLIFCKGPEALHDVLLGAWAERPQLS